MNILHFNIDGDPNNVLEFKLEKSSMQAILAEIRQVFMAHIEELKEKGIPAPDETPTYFPRFPQMCNTRRKP